MSSFSKEKTIMIVDDELDILHIVRQYLEKWGFKVETFSDPSIAFQAFKQDPKAYSLCLLDMRMPEMSGIVLAAMMRKTRPDIKILIMTAFELVAEDLKPSLPTIKHDDIIQKPFKMVQICTAVKKQLKSD
ncbi:MAG TPA: response regulator [Nitrososphaera sp.]|jgi:DNA-binding NtrC family response regulator